jgi:acetyltransferase-like isoleucine patch superfamily enzyme
LNFFSCFLGIKFVTKFLSSSSLTFLFPYIISKFGAKVGDNVVIKNIIIDNPKRNFENLKIGSNVYIGKNVFFDLPDEIILEDDVVIAANVQFFTHSDIGSRL